MVFCQIILLEQSVYSFNVFLTRYFFQKHSYWRALCVCVWCWRTQLIKIGHIEIPGSSNWGDQNQTTMKNWLQIEMAIFLSSFQIAPLLIYASLCMCCLIFRQRPFQLWICTHGLGPLSWNMCENPIHWACPPNNRLAFPTMDCTQATNCFCAIFAHFTHIATNRHGTLCTLHTFCNHISSF